MGGFHRALDAVAATASRTLRALAAAGSYPLATTSRARGNLASRALLPLTLCTLLGGCLPLLAPTLAVLEWSPSSERVDPSGGVQVWVQFSRAVEPTRAEQAFTLSEDGTALEGRFLWEGDKLCFSPLREVRKGHRYLIVVTTEVESPDGVSLDQEFRFAFSTRAEDVRPKVTRIAPADGSTIDDLALAVELSFSEPVDRASFLGAFSVSPSVTGSFSWSADGASCSFAPAQPWAWQTEYTVRISDSLADAEGNTLAEEVVSRFTVGTDCTAPAVVEARNSVGGAAGGVALLAEDPQAAPPTATHGWESDWGIAIAFSEPVLREGLEGSVSVQPPWDFEIEDTSHASDRFVLIPRGRLARDTLYRLTIRRGIADLQGNATRADVSYLFFTDGPATRAPEVALLRFRSNPSKPAGQAEFFEYAPTDVDAALPLDPVEFPVGAARSTTLDLYLSFAAGAGPSLFSLMEQLAISATNSCLAISITGIAIAGFEDPVPAEVPGAAPIRIYLDLVNTSESGIVTVRLDGELEDSLANPLGTDWQLPLLK